MVTPTKQSLYYCGWKVSVTSRMATAEAVVHNSTGDDVENHRKKPKTKASDSVSKLSSDVVTRTKPLSHTVKRKSDQLTAKDSGCSVPKKPSPEHIVSVLCLFSVSAALSLFLMLLTEHQGECPACENTHQMILEKL